MEAKRLAAPGSEERERIAAALHAGEHGALRFMRYRLADQGRPNHLRVSVPRRTQRLALLRALLDGGDRVALDEDVDPAKSRVILSLSKDARNVVDAGPIARACVDERREMLGNARAHVSEVQCTEEDRDRVGVVLVVRLAHEP